LVMIKVVLRASRAACLMSMMYSAEIVG